MPPTIQALAHPSVYFGDAIVYLVLQAALDAQSFKPHKQPVELPKQ